MSVALTKSLQVGGCAVFKLRDGKQLRQNPNIDSTTVTIPEIAFTTAEIPLMGTLEVVDTTRVDNIQLGIEGCCDNELFMELAEAGLAELKITWVSSHYDVRTGTSVPTGWIVYAKGYPTAIPNAEISVGADNRATINYNLISIRKVDLSGKELYSVDRSKGVVRINGNDLTAKLNSLF